MAGVSRDCGSTASATTTTMYLSTVLSRKLGFHATLKGGDENLESDCDARNAIAVLVVKNSVVRHRGRCES